MIASPPAIQRQISEALGIISNNDFPDAWPRLLPELVEQLQGAAEVTTMVGILETAASVFERFRGTYDTDDVRGVVVIAMQHFGVHLPAILSMLDGRLQALGGGAQKAALAPVLHAIKVCMQIFYLLSTVDLPEVFEDNLEKLMGYCHRYLDLKLPGVQAAAEDDQPGPVESLHAAVLDVVGLYNDKYDEDFAPFLQTFVQDTWGLLAGTPRPVLLSSALDNVVSSALRFLTSVASMLGNAKLFEQEASMRAVLEGVVLPSIRLRAYDVELFEDNPPDFIRGDIEGSDSETRRRSATELVRALTKNLNAQVTPMCSMFADQLLATYGSDKARHEVDKDAAVALVMAVAVKSATTSAGATATNELYNLLDFLRTHILPELSAAESIDARPIARASAIKFVANFRTLFGAAELHSLLPLLAPFTKSTNYVVHTYAAGAIEKILQVKDKAADGSMAARVSVDAVAPVATELLSSLFSRMMAPDYPENEYLMRCVLRLVVFSQAKIGGLTGTLVSALTSLVRRVCANPANPTFNHLLFESIAALMKVICRANPEAVGDFQALLFPPFQDVLQKAVVEFFPYVFQLLAELLELRPPPAPGASSLTDPYRSLLGPVLGQSLWTNKGNVPALTELLSVSGGASSRPHLCHEPRADFPSLSTPLPPPLAGVPPPWRCGDRVRGAPPERAQHLAKAPHDKDAGAVRVRHPGRSARGRALARSAAPPHRHPADDHEPGAGAPGHARRAHVCARLCPGLGVARAWRAGGCLGGFRPGRVRLRRGEGRPRDGQARAGGHGEAGERGGPHPRPV